MTLSTVLLLTLARAPLPIAGWNPPAPTPVPERVVVQPAAASQPPLVQGEPKNTVVAEPPAAEVEPARRHLLLTAGVAALALSPSLELELAPWDHVSLYGGGEFSTVRLGAGGQVGVRLRPMKGLEGPFLDLHVRFSRYAGLGTVVDAVSETGSPGVMAGVTLLSRNGFVASAGLGVSLLATTTTTRATQTGTLLSLPTYSTTSTTRFGPVPELRLCVGWAL